MVTIVSLNVVGTVEAALNFAALIEDRSRQMR
jgi:hypothetical protein